MSVDLSFDASVAGAPSGEEPYSLLAFPFPPGHFRVHAFTGVERLSRPYAFDVVVSCPFMEEADLERVALGQSGAFVMRTSRAHRAIHGVVSSIRAEGERGHRRAQYRVRLVPRFALLKHARTSRIFQDLSVPEVIERVLQGHGIAARWILSSTYPARRYITQYQESTLEFVERLLAEAGIFYTFGQPLSLLQGLTDMAEGALATMGPLGQAGSAVGALALGLVERETMVFGDDPSAYAPIDDGSALASAVGLAKSAGLPTEVDVGPVKIGLPSPVLSFHERAGMATVLWDKVTAFAARHAVRTARAEFRDYDPDRPRLPLVAKDPDAAARGLSISAMGATIGVKADVDVDPTKGVSASIDVSASLPQDDLEAYEHHGNFNFPDWNDVQLEAGRVLRARRRRAEVATGASGCTALSPGYRFTLDEHPIAAFNREYAVTRVDHRGAVGPAAELYGNTFACVRADVLYPPKKRSRPNLQATLTATVVGPAGEEIWVDAVGRIKVHFHWDREGPRNGESSCWLRSMQAWGGAGWGTQFIPRVGMEVVVAFDGGDPDRPLVIGSVYNGTHPMPFATPGDKTRSGFRSKTVQGEGGHNELSFEDAKGKEQLYLHAQRDHDAVVKRNHTLTVGADETISIAAGRSDTVGKDARYEVHGKREEIVRGDASIKHVGSRVDVVERSLDQRVSDVRTLRVGGREDVEVQGPAEHRFQGDLTTRVVGNHTWIVGKNDAPRTMTLRVEGVASISTEDALEIAAKKGIVLTCGKTSLRIGEDGIELVGASIRLAGEKGGFEASKDGVKMSSEKGFVHLSDTILVKTDKTSMSMGSEVKIDGDKILLNSPDKATDKPPADKPPPTKIELCDADGKPIASQRFVVELDDGSQRTGVTDKDGKAEIDIASNGKIRFPALTGLTAG